MKFLGAQKLICFGVSFSAFKDYFQMGESTARLCLRKLTKGIVLCSSISDYYLRTPSKSDARKIVALHKKVYGIDGCMGCLDVTKIHWGACPVAWKGQFEGKEGFPTIGLEAVSDYNLWIWHSAFGFPGSLNNINVWDRSPVLESMLDDHHDKIYFSFNIDGHDFDQLYYLVDGIYPSLSCFLTTIIDPTTTLDSFFAPKQEGWRKSIERAFGVLKKKFLSGGTKSVLYHREDMFYLVTATILMHNMMVEERIRCDEIESEENYVELECESANDLDQDEQVVHENQVNDKIARAMNNRTENSFKYESAAKKWNDLYNIGNAIKFTPSGGKIEVDITGEMVFEKHVILNFEVKDNGIGIPKDKIEMLAKPFVQLDSSSTREHQGTGLGLAISQKIIELMGGELLIKSEFGVGSVFSFNIFGKVWNRSDNFLESVEEEDENEDRGEEPEGHQVAQDVLDVPEVHRQRREQQRRVLVERVRVEQFDQLARQALRGAGLGISGIQHLLRGGLL